MPVYKDENKWRAVYRYTDWKGEQKQTSKRGFTTKRDALAWEREQLQKVNSDLDMTFEKFVETYTADMKSRVKENTWETKENIIQKKILPYFSKRKLSDIAPKDIIAWQNEIMSCKNKSGNPYSPTYLKTIHNKLSCLFNHVVKFYGLSQNPTVKVGNMGKGKGKEMQFWVKDEYLKFIDAVMDKPMSFYAFEVLYWCGIREGELLALTPADFDFNQKTLSITKSYQRLKGRDLITTPKTPKSNRVINISQFLCDEMQNYIKSIYGVQPNDRIFNVTKYYLHSEMKRGTKKSGVKKIRIHDLRHSHISLLIDMGFTPLAIADRVGHESIDITLNYAHLFPSRQIEMADKLELQRTEEDNDNVTENL